jgi:hypothetical protein
MWLAIRRGVYIIIEQPADSLLWLHPRIERIFLRCPFRDVRLELGAFGADSPKPLRLKFNVPWGEKLADWRMHKDDRLRLRDLKTAEGLQTYKVTVDSSGKKRSTGGSDLKATEAYPPGFGAIIGMLHREFVDLKAGMPASGSDDKPSGSGAKVHKVCASGTGDKVTDFWKVPYCEEGSESENEAMTKEGDDCLDDIIKVVDVIMPVI